VHLTDFHYKNKSDGIYSMHVTKSDFQNVLYKLCKLLQQLTTGQNSMCMFNMTCVIIHLLLFILEYIVMC